jgi:hypothetical protein
VGKREKYGSLRIRRAKDEGEKGKKTKLLSFYIASVPVMFRQPSLHKNVLSDSLLGSRRHILSYISFVIFLWAVIRPSIALAVNAALLNKARNESRVVTIHHCISGTVD